MWVGARGAMSRKATTRSSSWRRSDGIVAGRRSGRTGSRRPSAAARRPAPSPQHRLRAHQEPDRADQAGHQVRHVALALGPFQPRLVVGGGPDADQPAQVRALDEERDAEVDEVDRRARPAARAAGAVDDPSATTSPSPVSASPIPIDDRAVGLGPQQRTGRRRSPTRPWRAGSAARTAAGSTAGPGSTARMMWADEQDREVRGHRRRL